MKPKKLAEGGMSRPIGWTLLAVPGFAATALVASKMGVGTALLLFVGVGAAMVCILAGLELLTRADRERRR